MKFQSLADTRFTCASCRVSPHENPPVDGIDQNLDTVMTVKIGIALALPDFLSFLLTISINQLIALMEVVPRLKTGCVLESG
jgi:hypothetical protein